MKTQLKLLFDIQRIDSIISGAVEQEDTYRQKIQHMEEDLKKEEDVLLKDTSHLAELEKNHLRLEGELKSLEDQKKKIEDKLLSIKTNKEYQAALQEIESINAGLSKKEDEILESMDAIDAARTLKKKHEATLSRTQETHNEKIKQLQEELSTFLSDVEQHKRQKEHIIREVDKSILEDYEQIKKSRRDHIAIALADNEQCMQCNMKIPPQIYNEVVLGEKLITCPNCHRILLVDRQSTPASEEARAALGSGSA